MAKKTKSELGFYAREWRDHRDLSLEEAARLVALEAEARGLDLASRKIPTSHASLSRIEKGVVDYTPIALELLAAVYGVPPLTLLTRRPTDAPSIDEIYEQLTAEKQAEAVDYLRYLKGKVA